jgi:predicted ATPase/class 3 adenylate cyclase/DNA-binding CsgD family transcriptional regulator
MPRLPIGTVTFLFADLEASTRLLEWLGDRYQHVLGDYRRILRTTLSEYHGKEIDTQGDALFAAFVRATDAMVAAVSVQRQLSGHHWPEGVEVRARIGLHTGEPLTTHTGYVGMDVPLAARICHAGYGGQILLSETTRNLVRSALPDDVQLRDLGAYRLKDMPEEEHLYQACVGDLPSTFPPLRAVGNPTHNLPRALTRFVGREHEVAEIRRLLSTTPLLTLTGAGGSGKTRLALESASGVLDQYEDGAWLVQLDSLINPDLVPQVVAAALGIREEPHRTLTDTIARALGPKSLLLVLDNCEHLLDACARLVQGLLQAAPNLRILATSREPLSVAGEVLWSVPTLSVPTGSATPIAGHLLSYDAVKLFVDRATSVRSTFTVNDASVASVAEICRQLDGIPLAIELAAARVPMLTVEQIASRLSDRFDFLTTGSRSALPRHRTLRAAMDWSYDLLPPLERVLLQRISVFAGGWTLDAAEAICAGGPIGGGEVLDLLAQLIHKSLVMVDSADAVAARYRLLETVRQYAGEKLVASDEAILVRARHRDWFLHLAEQAEPQLRGPHQAAWLERVAAELDNLRAAMEWCGNLEGDSLLGLRIATSLGLFWAVRAYLREGRQWLERMMARTPDAPTPLRARALDWIGVLAWWQGEVAAVKGPCERALAISRAVDYRWGSALALHQLAHVAQTEGDAGKAVQMMEDSVNLFREDSEPWGLAYSLNCLGDLARIQGRLDRAGTLLEEAIAIWRRIDNIWGLGISLHNLGHVVLRGGEPDRTEALFAESIAHFRATEATPGMIFCLAGLAGAAARRGQLQRAARLFGAADALMRVNQLPLQPVDRTEFDRNLASVRQGLAPARFEDSWAAGSAMTLDEALAHALAPVGREQASPTGARPGRETPLTAREQEVASLIAQGSSNREIATRLVISERTAGTHVQNILNKLGFNTRAQIAAWAAEHGLHPSSGT